MPLTAEERAKIAMRLVSENMWGATRRALKGRLPAAYAYAAKGWEIAQLIGSYRRAAKERPAISRQFDGVLPQSGSQLVIFFFDSSRMAAMLMTINSSVSADSRSTVFERFLMEKQA